MGSHDVPPPRSAPDRAASRGVDVRLQVRSGAVGGCAVVYVAGEVDHQTAPLLRSQAAVAAARAGTRLVVDFEKVTFCDSSGIAALVRLRQDVAGRLRLTRADPHFLHLIGRYGLGLHLKACATVTEAVAELTAADHDRSLRSPAG